MIDTHCHIDDEQYQEDFEQFIAQQQQEGVEAILVPGVNLDSAKTVLPLCAKYPNYLYPALGIHPEDIKENWQQQWADLETIIRANKLVAIGEIGLDYYWDSSYKKEQQDAFRAQLILARELNLPVMVHIREAMEDAYRILKEIAELPTDAFASLENAAAENYHLEHAITYLHPLRGVVHCFTGSKEMGKLFIDLGFYLGIGGVITFKNCKLADQLKSIPLSALVLETDAPYLSPVPNRGKRNESRWMRYVAQKLAEVYETSEEDIIETTSANAKSLFCVQ